MTRRWFATVLVCSAAPLTAAAQQAPFVMPPPPPIEATLTLDQALDQAKVNSPDYLRALTAAAPAQASVRNAYALLAPSINSGVGVGYTGSGTSQFGGSLTNETPSIYGSNYQFQAQWQLNGQVWNGPPQAKANEEATTEDITFAGVTLRSSVITQYLTALEQTALVDVGRQQVARNEEFLKLAQARFQVGQGTLVDVKNAEAQLAQAQVDFLRAVNNAISARLELYRIMGVELPAPPERIGLVNPYEVTEPTYNKDQLLAMAAQQNPALLAEQARSKAATYGVKAAKSQWVPTLGANATLAGFTQQFSNTTSLIGSETASAQAAASNCLFENQVREGLNLGGVVPDCYGAYGLIADGSALQPAVVTGIENSNNVWPFKFSTQPFQVNLFLSYPLFDNFGRSLKVSQAKAQEQSQNEITRAQAIRVRTNVERRYYELEIAYRAIGVQEASRIAANEQLLLARERFRVGAGSALDVVDAQNNVTRADGLYYQAVYSYHRAIAALEEAVGRPLR